MRETCPHAAKKWKMVGEYMTEFAEVINEKWKT